MRKLKNPYNCKQSLPRMSWHPQNLFNLHERTYGPESKETNFSRSSKSVYWQRWKSKAVTRGYHGDLIQEKNFKRHYLPISLPALATKSSSRGRLRYGSGEARIPLAALMYQELERRLDVVVFRCCFADSVYEARRMVVHGAVKLNGIRCNAAWTRLHPGDMITVDPSAIPMLNPGKTWPAGLGEAYVVGRETPKPKRSSEHKNKSTQSTEVQEGETVEATPELAAEVPEADEDEPPSLPPSEPVKPSAPISLKPSNRIFTLPPFAAPFLFIPPYLEVSFRLCSAVYLRAPTSGPGYCEVPTPWDADGEVMRLAWEWYTRQGYGRRIRKERKQWDALRELKRDPFAELHLRKNSVSGRVAVHGSYEGGKIGSARSGSGEPRLFPQS